MMAKGIASFVSVLLVCITLLVISTQWRNLVRDKKTAAEQLPEGAHNILNEADAPTPAVFNETNVDKVGPPYVPNGLPNPFADEVKQ